MVSRMKNIFLRTTPMQRLETELKRLRGRETQLADWRAKTKTQLDEALAVRERFLLDGDLADSKSAKTLQAKVDATQSEMAGIDLTLNKLAASIVDVERQLAEEEHRVQRQVVSEKLKTDLAAACSKVMPWLANTRELAVAFEVLEPANFESGSIARYLRNAVSEIEIAANFVTAAIDSQASAIYNGHAPLPNQPALAAAPQAASPATTKVFTVKPICWQDQGNAAFTRRHPAFSQVDLAPALADRAIVLSAAIAENDPRVRPLSRGRSPVHAALEECVRLDGNPLEPAAEPDPQHDEPIKHSAFNKGRDFLGA
jgi:hypothetical protein